LRIFWVSTEILGLKNGDWTNPICDYRINSYAPQICNGDYRNYFQNNYTLLCNYNPNPLLIKPPC